MKYSLFLLMFACSLKVLSQKPKVVISADFPPIDVIPGSLEQGPLEKRSDPDDIQSMVRFLLYSNEFKIEGLIAASATLANVANKQHMVDMIDVYDKVDENLRKHDPSYPVASTLKKIVVNGLSGSYGKPLQEILGEGKDSEASNYIIELLKKEDEDSIWFCFWGGTQELAQALWRIKQTLASEQVKKIIDKIRVYMIDRQDGTGQWLMDTFPDMFIILNKASFKSFFYNAKGSDLTLGDLNWLNKNIRKGHGPMGNVYPESGWMHKNKGMIEGDTPSFLYLLSESTGLSDIEEPSYGSWGGRFERIANDKRHWIDAHDGGKSILRWQNAYQNDFAARIDRCIGKVAEVNHNPIARVGVGKQESIVRLATRPGAFVKLDASASADPDGDQLHYRWSPYPEAGTYKGNVEFMSSDKPIVEFTIPNDLDHDDIHLVLEVSDNGLPPLVSYKRIIISTQ